jgi:hypothetical protein
MTKLELKELLLAFFPFGLRYRFVIRASTFLTIRVRSRDSRAHKEPYSVRERRINFPSRTSIVPMS